MQQHETDFLFIFVVLCHLSHLKNVGFFNDDKRDIERQITVADVHLFLLNGCPFFL